MPNIMGNPVCEWWVMKAYSALIEFFGTQQKTADALQVDQGTVSGWIRGRHGMSAVTALRAERVTEGRFKARELCPALNDVG